MAMSKLEMLQRIQAGARNQNTPELSPEAVKIIQQHLAQQGQQGWNMPIAPAKPDPEADANAQINQAASAPALKLSTNGSRVPDSVPSGQSLPAMPDNPTDDEQSQMNKLMWLKQQSGQ